MSAMSRSKVSSALTETVSEVSSSGRGSIPRARSRRSGPSFPGSSRRRVSSAQSGQVADRLDRRGAEALLGARADSGKAAHREGSEKHRLAARGHDGQAAGLAPVARDLRDDLAGGDAERAGEARGPAHRGLHCLGDGPRAAEVRCHLADVQVALVHAGALDGRHDLPHRVPDRARVLPVEPVTRPQEDRLRAAAQRLGARHRRVDPEAARRVVGRRHHPAPVRVAADDERLLAQLRRLELLHRGEERVQVEVGEDHGARSIRRIGTFSRRATHGIVEPWTITEKSTTTNTIP